MTRTEGSVAATLHVGVLEGVAADVGGDGVAAAAVDADTSPSRSSGCENPGMAETQAELKIADIAAPVAGGIAAIWRNHVISATARFRAETASQPFSTSWGGPLHGFLNASSNPVVS